MVEARYYFVFFEECLYVIGCEFEGFPFLVSCDAFIVGDLDILYFAAVSFLWGFLKREIGVFLWGKIRKVPCIIIWFVMTFLYVIWLLAWFLLTPFPVIRLRLRVGLWLNIICSVGDGVDNNLVDIADIWKNLTLAGGGGYTFIMLALDRLLAWSNSLSTEGKNPWVSASLRDAIMTLKLVEISLKGSWNVVPH